MAAVLFVVSGRLLGLWCPCTVTHHRKGRLWRDLVLGAGYPVAPASFPTLARGLLLEKELRQDRGLRSALHAHPSPPVRIPVPGQACW